LADLGPWGPIAFAGIYIIATVAMLPGSMFTLLGSAIFGFWTAYIAVTVGSVVGAALAFLIARYAARRQVEEIAKTNSKFAAIDEAISDGGWKIVALLRLSPAVPFNVQNYLYGLTKIRFWPYVLTSWLAMIPGTLMYVHIGHAAGQAVSSREKTPLEWGLFGIGLLATIVVTVYVTKIARKKLADQTTLQLDDEAPRRTTSFPTIPVATATVLVALVLLVTLRG
ncbi:MAG: TVP38/TMEM64 family protein, partial [Planctomycetaceae bacterium]